MHDVSPSDGQFVEDHMQKKVFLHLFFLKILSKVNTKSLSNLFSSQLLHRLVDNKSAGHTGGHRCTRENQRRGFWFLLSRLACPNPPDHSYCHKIKSDNITISCTVNTAFENRIPFSSFFFLFYLGGWGV